MSRIPERWNRFAERSETLFGIEKWLQARAGKRPGVFYPLYGLFRRGSIQTVTPETSIVIEGFPRSANSFAVVAFNQAQGGGARIANNLHAPAQVMRAAKWNIPALVLIREPKDAVLSYAVRDPIPVRRALKYYISFYETLADYRDSFVLGDFEEVTSDYGAVIERINAKFATGFTPFQHTRENVKEVFAFIDETYERDFKGSTSLDNAVSRPSESRGRAKAKVEGELEDAVNAELLERARGIYTRLQRFRFAEESN